MAILTDGPQLGTPTIAEIRQAEAAHQHQVLIDAVLVAVLVVLVIAAVVLLPRFRRAKPSVAQPVRMPDPS